MPFLAKFYVWLGPVFFVIYLIAAAVRELVVFSFECIAHLV